MPRRVGLTKKTLARAQRDERAQRKKGGGSRSGTSSSQATADAFNNWQINLGLGTNNALSGGTYGFNPITRIRTLIEWMYRGNWLSRIIIDQVAKDMTRGGVSLQCDAEADDIKTLNNRMARLKVWPAICDTIKWARLYGGALGYIQIAGADPETPLRPDAIGRKSFRGILALDRWMLEPMLNRLVQEDGPDQGLPEFYRVTTDAPGLRGRTVHHSRCIRLTGIALPYWQAIMENYWGLSVFEPIYDRMIAFDSATMGAAQLAYKAHLRTMKIKGYRQIMGSGGVMAMGLAKQMELVRQTQSVEGMTVIDADDEFEAQQTSAMTGIAEIILQLGQQVSGGCQIPLTKLFGQSPAGLNSTGESDQDNYDDAIKQEQEQTLKDGVHLVYRVASVSEGIDLGPEFEIEFNPLRQLTDSEMGELDERDTRSVLAVQESGLISAKTALMEMKARGATTNRWQTITTEDIDEADDELPEVPQPGEVIGPDGKPVAGAGGAAAAVPGGIKPGGALRKELGERDAMPPPREFQGLPIVIECPKGGRRWTGGPIQPAHYGYIRGVGSAEGPDEWMDCFVGDVADAPYAFVLDQYEGERFDEHKVMMGFPDLQAAHRAYTQAYSGLGVRAHAATQMTMAQLRDWMARDKNQRRPSMLADRRSAA